MRPFAAAFVLFTPLLMHGQPGQAQIRSAAMRSMVNGAARAAMVPMAMAAIKGRQLEPTNCSELRRNSFSPILAALFATAAKRQGMPPF